MDLQHPSICYIVLSYGECMSCTFRLKFNSLRIIVIYRPPNSDFSIFFDEFYDLINNILHQNSSKVMIVGDFNYHFNCSSPPHSLFKQLTDSLGLNQHVYFPSHACGNIIDLISTPTFIYSCSRSDLLSDHYLYIHLFFFKSLHPPIP